MAAIPVQARRPLALLAPTWQTVEEDRPEHAQLVLLEHTVTHQVVYLVYYGIQYSFTCI